jgi:hypothetical protein
MHHTALSRPVAQKNPSIGYFSTHQSGKWGRKNENKKLKTKTKTNKKIIEESAKRAIPSRQELEENRELLSRRGGDHRRAGQGGRASHRARDRAG